MVPETDQDKLPTEQVRQALSRKYSTLRYKVEYNSYLSNHLLHAVVALHDLGANEQKIADYAAHYSQKLDVEDPDHEDVYEHAATKSMLDDDQIQMLLGKRQNYDALLAYYAQDVKKFGVDGAVRKHLPHLYSGLAGALMHGIIQLGYAYHIGGDRLVAEGLAYLHYSYLPFNEPIMPLSQNLLLQFTRQTVYEVVDAVTSNAFLRSEQDRVMSISPVKDLDIGWIQRGLNVLSGHLTHNSPRAFAFLWEKVNEFDFSDFDGTHALDMIMWLYVMLQHNDFIVLHAVTSAWSIQRLENLLSLSDRTKAWRVWFHVALSALITSRARDFRMQDVCPPEQELNSRLAELPTWYQLREMTIALPGFPDEHVYKLVQVACDHVHAGKSSGFLSATERDFVARTAAITVITSPFKPYTQQLD
ncbi:proteasome subunit beta type [Plasmopara halstedii]|uniref:Proteasome subunit beta type n=1 Tax=Plasmopara halstedii TaxID=4781 RepID=A0A0P1AH07_PLAHL|nr:proteasome subunit beta type [Plasmopara halstedii]CEG40074.1 proteasome subunit beta type [Plasmopara halstedii]|eukprot:XP_024576443.1 proteasome subunit beta type [Plasmopara halstedii]